MKLLNVKEVADMVGCSAKTIYSYVETGFTNIPYIKIGNGKKSPIRFKEDQIKDWLDSWDRQNLQSPISITRYNKGTETVAEPRRGDE